MIKLIDGLGQLGSLLAKRIKGLVTTKEILIYHTWNVWDRSEETQRGCYETFKSFVDNNQESKIIFISTLSIEDKPYLRYKVMAEAYLMEHHTDYKIIKFPKIIGKGVFQGFKDEELKPYGNMEIITLSDAVERVIAELKSPAKMVLHHGHNVPAYIVYELIRFAKN